MKMKHYTSYYLKCRTLIRNMKYEASYPNLVLLSKSMICFVEEEPPAGNVVVDEETSSPPTTTTTTTTLNNFH